MLQDIKGILTLVKENTTLTGLNYHAQEVVKLAQILHGKLLLKGGGGNPISVVIYE
jgi:hypothetical protein